MRGIDYGLGRTNIDHDTGIRYGVISSHSVAPEALDDIYSEAEYGEPSCPKCGEDARELDPEDGLTTDGYERGYGFVEFACDRCRYAFSSDEAIPDEPLGYRYEQDGYLIVDCLDSDLMVIRSPYYTYATFCSPCVPGAGDLDSPTNDGIKTYCLGPEWFDGDMPYEAREVTK